MMRVQLCGVRGSIPTPGRDFADVGGNTSCVAIQADEHAPALVLDAGTGLCTLSAAIGGRPFEGTIMLTHLHWDHMMGIPFFAAGDHPDARVTVLIPEQGEGAEALLARMMSPPTFPISPRQLRGRWRFETYEAGDFDIEGYHVCAREIPHKGGRTMGLRVDDGSAAVAYLPDHAPHQLGAGPNGVGELHLAARQLATDVGVLIHDAQFTRAELPHRFHWGHAAADYAVDLAEACGVARALLFHHDPARTDAEVVALRDEVATRAGVEVDVAREGDMIEL